MHRNSNARGGRGPLTGPARIRRANRVNLPESASVIPAGGYSRDAHEALPVSDADWLARAIAAADRRSRHHHS